MNYLKIKRVLCFLSMSFAVPIEASSLPEDERAYPLFSACPDAVFPVVVQMNEPWHLECIRTVCRGWYRAVEESLKQCVRRGSGPSLTVPCRLMTKAMSLVLKEDGFLMLGQEAYFLADIPGQARAYLMTLPEEKLLPLYDKFFKKTAPEEIGKRKNALSHLRLYCPHIYINSALEEEDIQINLSLIAQKLQTYLQEQEPVPHDHSFTGGRHERDLEAASGSACTFVVSSEDFNDPDLEFLLKRNHHHKVILMVEQGPFVKDGTFYISREQMPPSLKHLILRNDAGDVRSIASSTGEISLLESVELTAFQGLTNIGSSFFQYSADLKRLVLSRLPQLQHIEGAFSSLCGKLEEVSFYELIQLKSIGAYSLSYCPTIKRFDCVDLWALSSIEECVFGLSLADDEARAFFLKGLVSQKQGCYRLDI